MLQGSLKPGMRIMSINGQDVTRAARPTCTKLIKHTDASDDNVHLVVCFDPEGYALYDNGAVLTKFHSQRARRLESSSFKHSMVSSRSHAICLCCKLFCSIGSPKRVGRCFMTVSTCIAFTRLHSRCHCCHCCQEEAVDPAKQEIQRKRIFCWAT